MSTTTTNSSSPQDNNIKLWLQISVVWHLVVAVGALAGMAGLWLDLRQDLATWQLVLALILLLLLSLGSAGAALYIYQREHRGRFLSLLVNYLGFVACLIGSLHFLDIFLSLDALADNFGRGLIFFSIILIGYIVRNLGTRPQFKAYWQFFNWASRILIVVGGILFLLAIDMIGGLQALIGRFDGPLPIGLVLGMPLFGLMAWNSWRRPIAEALQATNSHNETIQGLAFLSPNLIGFLFFIAGPLLLSLYVSFTEWDAVSDAQWIGLQNYMEILNLDVVQAEEVGQLANEVLDVTVYDELARFRLFSSEYIIGAQDKLFWISLSNTLRFVLMAVPLSVIPALFLATILNSKLPGMKFFRAVYFLPSVAAVVGIALVWQWLFNSTIGYINYALTEVATAFASLTGAQQEAVDIRWLSSADTALFAVVIMSAWQWIGFNTVLFLAGLQNIPSVLYEAAVVDGANPWKQFIHVTVPLLAPTTFFVVVTTTIQAMQVFEQVFILIPGENPAGPGNSTLTMVLYLYQKGFQRFEQGYASAIAWVLFLLIFGATLFQFQRQRTAGSTYDN